MAKYLWYMLNCYLASIALLHTVLWLSVYPHCVKLLATLPLLPWDAGSVTDAKLLSIIDYLAICLLTPLIALLLVHWQQRIRRVLVNVPYLLLALLTVCSGASLQLSHHLVENLVLTLLLLGMTLLCLLANVFSANLMRYVIHKKACIHEP